jgi:hypothetical protein
LVMALLKNAPNSDEQIAMLENIERFIFIAFRITRTQANYRSSEFYKYARSLDRGEISTDDIIARLQERIEWAFDDDDCFRAHHFDAMLERKFANGKGFHGWKHLPYFLYEYEHTLLKESHQTKLDWTDLLKTKRDTISIEHIYPQTPTDEWEKAFQDCEEKERQAHCCSLGNLLLLSSAINSSLQNDAFKDKKSPKYRTDGSKARNGYSDGSHSELEVARESDWGPEQIQERGLKLLRFMEKRWGIQFSSKRRMLATLYPQLNSSNSASD